MRTDATIKNLNSDSRERIVKRNLSRILNIRIIEIDIDTQLLSFAYNSQKAFEDVKKELNRIGHPILNYSNTLGRQIKNVGKRNGMQQFVSSDSY